MAHAGLSGSTNRAWETRVGTVDLRSRREFLGMDVRPSEAETFCTAFLRKLARRGLRGVKLVISDAHETSSRPSPRCCTPLGSAAARALHAQMYWPTPAAMAVASLPTSSARCVESISAASSCLLYLLEFSSQGCDVIRSEAVGCYGIMKSGATSRPKLLTASGC
jgi:hypothetical protein